jgi:hypothetical protein
MSSHSKRSGAIRTGLVALLLVPILLAIWGVSYLWVERSSRELIYRKTHRPKESRDLKLGPP